MFLCLYFILLYSSKEVDERQAAAEIREKNIAEKNQQLQEREEKCFLRERKVDEIEKEAIVNIEKWSEIEKDMQKNAAKLPSVVKLNVSMYFPSRSSIFSNLSLLLTFLLISFLSLFTNPLFTFLTLRWHGFCSSERNPPPL